MYKNLSICSCEALLKNSIIKRNLYINLRKMEKAMETIGKNPYFKKYEAKIEQIRRTNPEQLIKTAEEISKCEAQNTRDFSKVAEKCKTSLPKAAYAFAPQKKLSSIMKEELLKDKTADEIKFIWTKYFSHKDAICGCMTSEMFEKIQDRASKYPMFVFALPRDNGYEFIYAQFAANEVHFTPLINYQAYQENAPECLTITHYPDLSAKKGVVLMHGEVNKDFLSTKEGQFLANQLSLYFGGEDPEKLDLLEKFHRSPKDFDHMTLIKHIEQIDLGLLSKRSSS